MKIFNFFCLALLINLTMQAITTKEAKDIINDLQVLAVSQLNPDTGVGAKIKKIADDATNFRVYMKCKTYPQSLIATKTGVKNCNEILTSLKEKNFSPSKIINSILDVLQNSVIGTKTSPGLLNTIVESLRKLNVVDVVKVKEVITDIDDVLSTIESLLNLIQTSGL